MEQDIRWKQRFSNFQKAFLQLNKFIEKKELNELEVQGLIKCFEYNFELSWKVMKDFLELEGYEPKSPRATIQLAFQNGLIEDGYLWIDALDKRNLMSHTYNEETALEAEKLIINQYFKMIKEFSSNMQGKL